MRGRENGDEHDGRGGRDARVPWAKRHVWVWSAGATQRSGAHTELSFFVPLQCGPATGYSITAFDIWTGRLETSSLDIEFNGVYPFQATDAVGNRSAGAAFGAQRRCDSLGLGGLQPPCQLAGPTPSSNSTSSTSSFRGMRSLGPRTTSLGVHRGRIARGRARV